MSAPPAPASESTRADSPASPITGDGHAPAPAPPPPAHAHTSPSTKNIVKWTVLAIVLIIALIVGIPWALHALATVSTDDAYVNGHVTAVAPRVPGQVAKVFVDDNNRVRKGDLLVQLDKEPYQIS